jgi:hypothetical protein
VLQVVEALVQVDGGVGARRVGEDQTEDAAHVAGLGGIGVFFNTHTREEIGIEERTGRREGVHKGGVKCRSRSRPRLFLC